MTLMLVLFFAVSVLLEIFIPFIPNPFGIIRQSVAAITAGLMTSAVIYLFTLEFSLFTCLIAFFAAYRIINISRAAKARMHPRYLRRACTITAAWLAGVQILAYLLGVQWDRLPAAIAPHIIYLVWAVIVGVQLLAAFVMWRSVAGHALRSTEPLQQRKFSSRELPSITVAIAARNETDSLLACIRSLLSSDYPKLEIIVLDDCSQSRKTPEIIRGFAHDGVRFIPGNEPDPTWLARNHAYHKLAEAATGEYILFFSSHALVEPDSIRRMVTYLLAHDKQMLSVMPRTATLHGTARLIETMQAAWELLPPRRYAGRPPIATACWMIARSAHEAAGGFAGVSRMVTPEVRFARHTAMTDSYSFVAGGNYYGVSSEADVEEQSARAVRSSYPAVGRRPELVSAVTLGTLVLVVVPFAQIWFVLIDRSWWLLSLLSLLSAFCLLKAYASVLKLTYGTAPYQQVISFPAAAILNIIFRHYSMYKYEFSEVIWKERNICVPVMHVYPKLPTAGSGNKS